MDINDVYEHTRENDTDYLNIQEKPVAKYKHTRCFRSTSRTDISENTTNTDTSDDTV